MLIDTHGHLNFAAFKDDYREVLQRAQEQDTWVVMPGSQYDTSRRAVEIAEEYGEGVYAAVGLHPIHVGEKREVDVLEVQSEPFDSAQGGEKQPWEAFSTRAEEFDYAKYKALAERPLLNQVKQSPKKVVAIGECGLDYYREPKGRERREAQRRRQKATLAVQVRLAQERELPLILHCRKAHEELLEFLQPHKGRLRGVVHCYTGDLKQAERFYELGLFFGFNGLIFKEVPALPNPRDVIGALPLDRIVLETDSPYLVPPQAGVERNEPAFVRYVAEEIARIKGIPVDEVASQTTANAKTLFCLN